MLRKKTRAQINLGCCVGRRCGGTIFNAVAAEVAQWTQGNCVRAGNTARAARKKKFHKSQ